MYILKFKNKNNNHYIELIFLSSPIYHKVAYNIFTYYECLSNHNRAKYTSIEQTNKKTYNDTSQPHIAHINNLQNLSK
jgi:hypothetical protein